MSIKVMTMVWDNYPEGGSELLIALALADIGRDDGGRIYPGIKLLASKTRMSERSVQNLLSKMVGRGILVIVKPGGFRNGQNHATTYRIDIDSLQRGGENFAPPPPQNGHEEYEDNPVDNLGGVVQTMAGGGAKTVGEVVQPAAPYTLVNVKSNPTPVDKDQSQNQPAGPACANPACRKSLRAGFTTTQIGNVCQKCWSAYMAGTWDWK